MFQCNILILVDLVCYATKMNKSLIKEYDMHFFFFIRKMAFYVTYTVDRTYSEGNSASQKNCRLSSNRSSIDKMKQLSINELLDNLHPYYKPYSILGIKAGTNFKVHLMLKYRPWRFPLKRMAR